jgi:hypothetical protein
VKKLSSVPLNESIVSVVNDLISSRQRYKLLSKANLGAAVAKAVFDPEFVGGAALECIINQSKKWLRKNVFSPAEILKQRIYGEVP